MRVDDSRDRVVVDVAVPRDHALDASDAFFLGLVGQHRAPDHVADRIDAFDRGGEVIVDRDASSFIGCEPDGIESETVGVRHTPDGDQHAVALDGVGAVAFDRHAVPFDPRADDLAAQLEHHALLPENLVGFLRRLGVHAGQDAVEVFEHRHLRAEPEPYRTHLEADVARSDHHQAGGHFVVAQRLGAGGDAVTVQLDTGQGGRLAPVATMMLLASISVSWPSPETSTRARPVNRAWPR